MVDPEIIAVNLNRQNIFYTCSTWAHTGDDQIKVLPLLYTAKLQVIREMMPPTVIYSNLHTAIMNIENIIGTFDLKTVSLGWRSS